MEKVVFTLNGSEATCDKGQTILEAARAHGVSIPTLCHDTELCNAGVCRICLVQDERRDALLASCVAPVEPGMQIRTDSAQVRNARRGVLQLLLSTHPESCVVCEKRNRCRLRELATELDVGEADFPRLRRYFQVEDQNPFIERDLSFCVLCGKCIRACDEIHGVGAVEYAYRAFESHPATSLDLPLAESSCDSCGLCVSKCPVAALVDKEDKHLPRETARVRSVCPYCSGGCPIVLKTRGGRLLGVEPDPQRAVPKSSLCVKGQFGIDFCQSGERLTSPLVRKGARFEKVSWEKAIGFVAERFAQAKAAYGPDALAVVGAPKCSNEDNYLLGKYTRTVLGTNNIDANSAFCIGPISRMWQQWGSSWVPSFDLGDLAQADVIVLIGTDPAESQPVVAEKVIQAVRKAGTRLLIVDPRRNRLSEWADCWLRIRPGTDVHLASALAGAVAARNLQRRRAANPALSHRELQELVRFAGPARRATGVKEEEVGQAARLLRAGRLAVLWGTGVTQQVNAELVIDAWLSLLGLARGSALAGVSFGFVGGQSNSVGAWQMGASPTHLPGGASVTDERARSRLQRAWNASVPSSVGLSANELPQAVLEGSIKALYVVGQNPVASWPFGSRLAKALQSLDLLVVQDLFISETARLAHIVLPAAAFTERDGTFTNFEGRVQLFRRALDSPGEARPDWWIIAALASAGGYEMSYASAAEIMDEISSVVNSYEGINYSRLANESPVVYRSDRVRIARPRFQRPKRPARDTSQFPLTLTRVVSLYTHGTGVETRRSRLGRQLRGDCWLEVSPEDAERYRVNDGAEALVSSPWGRMAARVLVSTRVTGGLVALTGSSLSPETGALFGVDKDAERKILPLRSCPVRIAPLRKSVRKR